MKIEDKSFVAIEYVLTLDSGEVVDQSDAGKPLGFVFGCGQLIPGLEKQLVGMDKGDSATLDVESEDGYGPHRPELIQPLPRTNFPEDMEIEAGMVFQGHGPHGPIALMIKEVKGDEVIADLNHPLAGERLHFKVTIAEVRKATEEELSAATAENCEHGECQGCGAH